MPKSDKKGLVIGQTYTEDEVRAMFDGDGVVFIGFDEDEDDEPQAIDDDALYETVAKSSKTVYVAEMPDVFREGITAIAETPAQAVAVLRQEYFAYREGRELQRGECDWFTFEEAARYFYVSIMKVKLGTASMRDRGTYLKVSKYIPGFED